MLENYLSCLTKRQSMLLLTAVTFGGQDSVAALGFLPEAEAELLKHRAQELLKVPRERRIPMLVQEIKRLFTPRRGQLWATGPEQLAQVMLRERPALRQVLLKALPSGLADSVRRYLPPDRGTPKREARGEVLSIVRATLEEMLARATPVGASFKFADVLLLQPREMLNLLDELGARSLGPALAGLPENLRGEFIAGLTPGARERAAEAAAASVNRKLLEDDANEVFVTHAGDDSTIVLRSAGAQRLARALLAQSPEFAARVLERHPGDLGILIGRWSKKERFRAVNRGDGGRAEIVAEMERLATRGLLDRPLRPVHAAPVLPPLEPKTSQPPKDPRLRPPLLPPLRAQAALRMAAVGLQANRLPPPARREAASDRAPSPPARSERPAGGSREPKPPGKSGGRGPRGGGSG